MKVSKASVSYSTGRVQSHCGPTFLRDHHYCKFFIPSAAVVGCCEKVEGKIEPSHWCELFQKVSRSS